MLLLVFACVLSLSGSFQEITITLWQEVTCDVTSFSFGYLQNKYEDTQNIHIVKITLKQRDN